MSADPFRTCSGLGSIGTGLGQDGPRDGLVVQCSARGHVEVRSQSGKPVARIDKQEEGCRSAHKEDILKSTRFKGVGGQQVTPTEPSSANAAGPGLERPLRVESLFKFSS